MDINTLILDRLEKSRAENGVLGLSCAVFADKDVLLECGLGQSTYGYAIDPDTLFSIQSITKPITGLATIIAQSRGLIALEKSPRYYLPGFTVHSAFEEHPEEHMTLRMMLKHTAGFTHEAPIGNNFDCSFSSYEDHLKSIGSTWLKFPVGMHFSYSNLGYDLLAQILQETSGKPFSQFLKEAIFQPIGMESTTADDSVFVGSRNKTEGVIPGVVSKHYPIPLIGSGSVYSNCRDMTKLVRFYLSRGQINGRQVIPSALLDQALEFGHWIKPALDSYQVGSDGGGFGFGCTIGWFPEYQMGCVMMGSKPGDYQTAARSILEAFIGSSGVATPPKTSRPMPRFTWPEGQSALFETVMRKIESAYQPDWAGFCGSYSVAFGGFEQTGASQPLPVAIAREGDTLKMTGAFGESVLRQYQPGLFFTQDGEALDMRQGQPTFRNVRLQRLS